MFGFANLLIDAFEGPAGPVMLVLVVANLVLALV
jgi:hypothetical protein